ncbi:hypothetical protein [Rhizobacter sp. LjRoot28]|jgi:hypothetical protein|uniref:hypothetical protein n=1 Tax=Rhizobacter sp. LjRoot28 TaxID=3342309 RepID=UPI003ECE6314
MHEVPYDLTDADWVEQVSLEMLQADRSLSGSEVHAIAQELAGRPRWRALSPRAASRKAIEEPEAVEGV